MDCAVQVGALLTINHRHHFEVTAGVNGYDAPLGVFRQRDRVLDVHDTLGKGLAAAKCDDPIVQVHIHLIIGISIFSLIELEAGSLSRPRGVVNVMGPAVNPLDNLEVKPEGECQS